MSSARRIVDETSAAHADKEVVFLPWASHGLPYIPHSFRPCHNDPHAEFDLQAVLYGFALEIGDDAQKNTYALGLGGRRLVQGKRNEHSNEIVMRMSKKRMELFRLLYAAVMFNLEYAYSKGVSYGRNLLAGLASGEISVPEFNVKSDVDGTEDEDKLRVIYNPHKSRCPGCRKYFEEEQLRACSVSRHCPKMCDACLVRHEEEHEP